MNSVRNVTVDNCVITGSNRGIAFMVYDGGYVENVVLSNLIVNTQRFDWFWWGNGDPIYFTIQRRSESQGLPPKPDEPPAGVDSERHRPQRHRARQRLLPDPRPSRRAGSRTSAWRTSSCFSPPILRPPMTER